MKLEDFFNFALNNGFTLRRRNGNLEAIKNGTTVIIKENIEIDCEEFIKNFEKSLPDDFHEVHPDILPSFNHEGGMLMGPDDPIFATPIGKKRNENEIIPPPLARFDDIMPSPDKKNRKKRTNDPNPNHFKGPGKDGDPFI